jgi:beta-lysine 5,6-aminomutase alpha subunit
MNSKLNIDQGLIDSCMEIAKQISDKVTVIINTKTTVSIERTIARLLGVDGINNDDIPLPNVLVDHIYEQGIIDRGLSYWLGNAIIHTGKNPQDIVEMIDSNDINLNEIPRHDENEINNLMINLAKESLKRLNQITAVREEKRRILGENNPPHTYILTATGNVYEDVIHSLANAKYGGDIIAVIRSTAQSLLDYVPYGATTEGYGGTYATQENFRIMRKALDEWSDRNKRYMRLSSFSSGLCMPEIAAMGALEGLDNMVNDALYGILYRDINIIRNLVDQKMSRMINGYAGIVINTGEDNYLRTADALEAAPSVVASQMINYFFALDAGVSENLIAIGNSFEIDPNITNGLLLEWAQAQLTRELFPNCQTKYMPPTKHMNGNIFRTHAIDTLFNLITVSTNQSIQTIGVPTEGIYTPSIYDRILGLENVKYVFNTARDLGDEIVFKPGGIIQNRAQTVLSKAHELLSEINEVGLFSALEKGVFGDVKRSIHDGKGKDGVIEKAQNYFNPFYELILGKKYVS